MTLDLGHCAFFKEVSIIKDLSERVRTLNNVIRSLILELGPKLFLVHAHNVDPINWKDCVSLPRGVIDFNIVIDALVDVEYKGFFVIELEEREAKDRALESGEFLSGMLSKMR